MKKTGAAVLWISAALVGIPAIYVVGSRIVYGRRAAQSISAKVTLTASKVNSSRFMKQQRPVGGMDSRPESHAPFIHHA